jgi:hypothetical protein
MLGADLPSGLPLAVCGSFGSSTSPVNARRGPRSSASSSRRRASDPLMRSRWVSTSPQFLLPTSDGAAWLVSPCSSRCSTVGWRRRLLSSRSSRASSSGVVSASNDSAAIWSTAASSLSKAAVMASRSDPPLELIPRTLVRPTDI